MQFRYVRVVGTVHKFIQIILNCPWTMRTQLNVYVMLLFVTNHFLCVSCTRFIVIMIIIFYERSLIFEIINDEYRWNIVFLHQDFRNDFSDTLTLKTHSVIIHLIKSQKYNLKSQWSNIFSGRRFILFLIGKRAIFPCFHPPKSKYLSYHLFI